MSGELPVAPSRRDWLGIGCSGLCIIHCAAPLLLAFFGSSLAGLALFGEEWLHYLLLLLVPAIALWSLLPSRRVHGRIEPLVLAGVGLPLLVSAVVLGHELEAPLSIAGGLFMLVAHALNRHWLRSAPAATRTAQEV
ncbi:MAG: MerC domain-containing protein [Pseudohaliea sp.]